MRTPRLDPTLRCLARLEGIALSYFDARGQRQVAQRDAVLAMLRAMGISVDSPAQIQDALKFRRAQRRTRFIEPVTVILSGAAELRVVLVIADAIASEELIWELAEEGGGMQRGTIVPATLPCLRRYKIATERYTRCQYAAPVKLADGYHALSFYRAGQLLGSTTVIVSPLRCFVPPGYESGQRIWALGAQLYSFKSATNGGLGNYSDLNDLIDLAAELNASAIGLNPLHARRLQFPQDPSPYSPSSRAALEAIFIDPMEVSQYQDAPFGQVFNSLTGSQQLINYAEVVPGRLQRLRELFQHFCRDHLPQLTSQAQEFLAFVAAGGPPVERAALFEALEEYFVAQGRSGGWPSWPAEYQAPDAEGIPEFIRVHGQSIKFYQYLQWHVTRQLGAAAARCAEKGVALGLYLDLALGSTEYGADVWSSSALYLREVGMGAPPDELNLKGQNWGLPPFKPSALREVAYRPVIEALRLAMRFAGAVRIDHVMSLSRIFCVPKDYHASQGVYLRYRSDELFAILALESVRHQAVVIGEDLGTVSPQFRAQMSKARVLQYKLLMFMKDGAGNFLPCGAYPRDALAAFGTHDVATLRGYFEKRDLELRTKLGLFPSAELKVRLRDERAQDMAGIAQVLESSGISAKSLVGLPGGEQERFERLVDINRFLARTPSYLIVVPLEDIVGEPEQVNVPGVTTEYPCWQRRLPLSVLELRRSYWSKRLAEIMREEGRGD